MFTLLFGGLVNQIKAQKQQAEPCLPYKPTRTIAELHTELTKSGEFYDNLRQSYVDIINAGLAEEKLNLRVKTSNLGWVLDSSVIVDETFINTSDYENGLKNGNKIGFTNLQGQKSKYLAFKYKGHYIVFAKIACGNPYRKKTTQDKTKVDIAQKPEEKVVATTSPKTDEAETTTSDEPCYKEVWKTQQYWEVEKVMYRPDNAAGWYTGYYGLDNGHQSYNRRVLKTRKVKVLVPCEETSSNVEDEELPIATRDSETDEETTERVKTKRPIYIRINGNFVFYRDAVRMVGGRVPQTGGPAFPGGNGGRVAFPGSNGPAFPGGLH